MPRRAELGVPAAHTAALFLTMRVAEGFLWPDPFADPKARSWFRHYGEAFGKPPLFDPHERAFEWDHDRWTINVLGHGLLGSELYYRPRRCGASPLGAFAFAMGATVAWEYAFEGNGVRPSALDLVYTPLAGAVLGEGRYWGWTLARQIRSPVVRGVFRVVLDPLGEIERSLGSVC
ncbi:MAG TPA: DUF3943 domain-containing protein [Polyangiaceae bacterium]|nr:DUF3943 domain-containing protein [Polyangiaceae bacterium]